MFDKVGIICSHLISYDVADYFFTSITFHIPAARMVPMNGPTIKIQRLAMADYNEQKKVTRKGTEKSTQKPWKMETTT